ncbi:hypothetical protein BU14_0255s0018, partial [Porphyra umbilicalis]
MLTWPRADSFTRPIHEIWSAEEIPGYEAVVERPMDLGTVLRNADTGAYITPTGAFDATACANDVLRTFANAMSYNAAGTTFHNHAKALTTRFRRRLEKLPPSPLPPPPPSVPAAALAVPPRPPRGGGSGKGAPKGAA